MKLTVLFGSELLAAHLGLRQLVLKDLAFTNVFLARRINHDRAEDCHLSADRRVTDEAIPPLAVLLSPDGIGLPSVLADQGDLRRTDITVELSADDGVDDLPALELYLSRLDTILLKIDEVFRDLAKGAIKNRHLMLDAEAHIGVLVEGLVLCRIDVGGLKGNRLVTVCLGELHPAVPVAMLHVSTAEDDEAGLEFLGIGQEAHGSAFCAGFVYFFPLSY